MRFNLLSRGLSFEANLTLIVGILSVVGCVNGVPVQVGSEGSEGTPESKAVQSTADQPQVKVVNLEWGGSVNQLKHGTDTDIALSSALAYLSKEEQEEWSQTCIQVAKEGLPRLSAQLAVSQFKLDVMTGTFPIPVPARRMSFRIEFMLSRAAGVVEGNISVDEDKLIIHYGGSGTPRTQAVIESVPEKSKIVPPKMKTLRELWEKAGEGKKMALSDMQARVKAARTGSTSGGGGKEEA
ncbi:hypothetical protein C8R42DRAFT_640990 [Lentinula raphanica]|nr:hypothetical protein C8R42DRAFT_640990 [Lentinula raphanica]